MSFRFYSLVNNYWDEQRKLHRSGQSMRFMLKKDVLFMFSASVIKKVPRQHVPIWLQTTIFIVSKDHLHSSPAWRHKRQIQTRLWNLATYSLTLKPAAYATHTTLIRTNELRAVDRATALYALLLVPWSLANLHFPVQWDVWLLGENWSFSTKRKTRKSIVLQARQTTPLDRIEGSSVEIQFTRYGTSFGALCRLIRFSCWKEEAGFAYEIYQ